MLIDHLTVECLVVWPQNKIEAAVDFVLMETSLLYLQCNDAFLVLISRNLHKRSSEVSIKTRSTPASLSFRSQTTEHTSVKWSILKKMDF